MPGKRQKPAAPSARPPTLEEYVQEFCDAPMERGAVNRLSKMLARVIGAQLESMLPNVDLKVGPRSLGGTKRRHHLDAFVANAEHGLQLGVDVKGLNSGESVGKNWNNRIGDLHELATNHHSTSRKTVLGGVLAIPREGITPATMANIQRAMANLGGRRAIADAQNLLECACLIVISKEERRILDSIPESGSPLRIEIFAPTMAKIFKERWT
jgi:hypothetical protein